MRRGHSRRPPPPSGAARPSSSQPWCIGAIFPAVPHASSSSPSTPHPKLFFELCDDARVILHTGAALTYDIPYCISSDPRTSVSSFLSTCIDDFFPSESLCEYLGEDKCVGEKSKSMAGNCLEGIQNMGGHVQLFFPVGPGNGNLGSCAYFPNSHESATSEPNMLREPQIYSSRISNSKPILQITADKSACCNTMDVSLAVRTLDQVHCLTSQMEDDRVLLSHPESLSFRHCTSHIVWNSHIPGEAAVMLENGDINIFDFKSQRLHDPCFMVNMKEDIDEAVSRCSDEVFPITNKKPKRERKVMPIALSRKWTCEYAWHPKNLIVAGKKKLFLVDLRQKHGNEQMCSCIADCCVVGLASYCNQHRKNERFTSLSRAEYDGMFQFAAASTYHVLLYDIRQPKTPLLQWEHRMPQYPPDHLQMYSLSDFCSSTWQGINLPIVAGRIIVGSSFKSGDVHAFFYGPHSYPDSSFTTLSGFGGRGQMENLESISNISSWQFPVKLKNPKLNMKSNIERNFATVPLPFEFYTPVSQMDPLFGVFNFFPTQDMRKFTILQLTGKGCITSQNYEISGELDSRNFYKRTIGFQQTLAITKSEIHKSEGDTLVSVPSFLDYIRYGILSSNSKIKSSSEECYHGTTAKHKVRDISDKLNEAQNDNDGIPEVNLRNEASPPPKENSFSKLDDELCPVMLMFKETGSSTLLSCEFDSLIGLKGKLQQWQKSYQPFLNYCSAHLPEKSGGV